MIVLLHFDWFGTAEELKGLKTAMASVCDRAEGVKYKGRYAPDNRKFPFVYMYEGESYQRLLES